MSKTFSWGYSIQKAASAVLLVAFGATGGYAAGSLPPDDFQQTPPTTEQTNVSCYKWVENGTAHVACDATSVYAPDSWVNITVKNCSEWEPVHSGEFQRDPPCGS